MPKTKSLYIFFAFLLVLGVVNLIKLNRNIDNFKDISTQVLTSTPTSVQDTLDSPNTSQAPSSSDYQIVLRKIALLEQEVASLKDQLKASTQTNQVTTNSQTDSLNMLEIADPTYKQIDVFDKPLASSKIIGQADYGIIYFYTTKQSGWYQINLDSYLTGWVQSQFIKELP